MGKLGWFMSRTQTLTSPPRESEPPERRHACTAKHCDRLLVSVIAKKRIRSREKIVIVNHIWREIQACRVPVWPETVETKGCVVNGGFQSSGVHRELPEAGNREGKQLRSVPNPCVAYHFFMSPYQNQYTHTHTHTHTPVSYTHLTLPTNLRV